jgi:hypothetical protein
MFSRTPTMSSRNPEGTRTTCRKPLGCIIVSAVQNRREILYGTIQTTWYYNWHIFDWNRYEHYEIYSLVYCNSHTAITILQNFDILHGPPRQVAYMLVRYGDNLPRWMYQKPHLPADLPQIPNRKQLECHLCTPWLQGKRENGHLVSWRFTPNMK